MRTASTIMCLLTLLGSTVSSAQSEAAAEAHAELEAKKAEAVASEPEEAAEAAPAPAPKPGAPAAQPEPSAPAASVDEKIAKLNLGAQIVFALAGQTKPLEGIDASMNPGQLVAAATQAGAFSIVGGVWIDEDAVRTKASSDKASWVTAHEKLSPLAEVDPTDGSAVAGKKTELLAAIEAVEPLVENYAGARGAELKEGLALFKLALDPPYAYGHSSRTIYAWTAASVGTMISMAGLGSLSNPLEREQGNFGWIAAGVGLTTAGIGAALIVLDDQ